VEPVFDCAFPRRIAPLEPRNRHGCREIVSAITADALPPTNI
jgi:hypothetical protein